MPPTESFPFELAPGERLIWSGSPRRGVAFGASEIVQTGIGIVFVYLFVQFYGVARYNSPQENMLWAGLFLGMMYFSLGTLFMEGMRRRRSVYAITSERLLMINSVFSRFVKSYPLRTITDSKLEEQKGGVGNIWIGRRYLGPGRIDVRLQPTTTNRNGLEMIPDAKHVYELFLAAREASLAAPV
jgi:hypothetical protein